MLFRATIVLFALFNTLQAPPLAAAKGNGSEVTVVGPTDNAAAFIAVRPVNTQMQPEARPVMTQMQPAVHPMMTTGMLPQPAAEEPQAQQGMSETMTGETMTGREEEMPEQTGRETMRGTGKEHSGREMPVRMEPRLMERFENMLGRPGLTTSDREMIRSVLTRMRGRRLQRRAAHQEMPRVTTPTPGTLQQERPAMEQPMTTPEIEQVTPAASEMSVRGARFNTAVGDIEMSRAMLGREGGTIPQTAIRDVEFNTFVGRLRGERTEFGRGMEPQWERVWMRRPRFVRGWEY